MPLASDSMVVVTGGLGYIGRYLAQALQDAGHRVRIVDNAPSSSDPMEASFREAGVELHTVDLLTDPLAPVLEDADAVCHLAASRDVRAALTDAQIDLEQNVVVTSRLLEAMRWADVPALLFTSTSTVYGDAAVVPTPEDYAPLEPISLYGATKLAAEAMIASYCHTFGLEGVSFRFANVVGRRSTHGVVPDFVQALLRDATTLEILGKAPGTKKSYCYIDDCIDGLLAGWAAAARPYDVFNLGSPDQITVREVADSVCEVLGTTDVTYAWSGGVDAGRGWLGDVRNMWLATEKLVATGWTPRFSSRDAVGAAAADLKRGP